MKYKKPPLSFDNQVNLLLKRGMLGDPELMKQRLSAISYYRLSGYWFPFRVECDGEEQRGDDFRHGTTFDAVWDRYVFDRALRLHVMDAVERIEIAVRTQLSYHQAHVLADPFAYAVDETALPNLDPEERRALLLRIGEEVGRSHDQFVKHYRAKYDESRDVLPIWMATEVMSLGSVLKLYNGSPPRVRDAIASFFGVPDEVLKSWLLTLNTVRNICAHHGRLWNRELGTKPRIPRRKRYPAWHVPVEVTGDRVFAVLTICAYCMSRVSPGSQWAKRLDGLLREHPRIPRKSMGFPVNWKESPLWKDACDAG